MLKSEEIAFRADLAKRGFELGEAVRECRLISAPASKVWNVISTPGQLNKYHPYCKSNHAIKWPGVGSRDALEYYSGIYFERDFMFWREGAGYDLQIGTPPRKTSWISWNIDVRGPAQSEASITVTPILEAHLRDDVKEIFVQTYFGESISIYLDSLLRGLEQFVVTGNPVQPKQFGPHPIYAP